MSYMRPPDYLLYQQQLKPQILQLSLPTPPPPPPLRPPDYLLTQRPWQLPPWASLLGNAAVLNTPPPPRIIQLPQIQPPQIQLALPDWGEWYPRRGGTRTDLAPPPQLTPPDLKTWLEMQEIKNMPPGLRKLYSAWLGAGRYAVITPALDVLARWLRREDPTKDLEEFQRRAEAASYAAPWAHLVGQGVGLAGIAGLTAEGLIARGVGASNIERLLSSLRASAKPAAVGGAAGAAAGATEGVLTGRDPFAEAAKYGSVGFMTGLGGVPWQRLAAAGILGATVGGTTAKEYGVGKGIEAGSTVFLLPIVAPVERGLGGVVLGTTRRPIAGLKTEVSDPRYAQIIRSIASQVRSQMEVRSEPGLTPEDVATVATQLRRNPVEQRGFFQSLVEDAVAKIRGGGDADVVLTQLRLIRQKLDPVSRMRFDEVLRQYRLTDVKSTTPEYSLREEDALALTRLFRREPEYALTDAAAQKLNLFLRREPEYALTDEAATLLDQFLRQEPRRIQLAETLGGPATRRIKLKTRSEPQYALTDETAVLLNQFLRQEPALAYRLEPSAAARQDQTYVAALAVPQRTRQVYAVAPVAAHAQETATAQTSATTTSTATTPALTQQTTTDTATTPTTTTDMSPSTPTERPPPSTPPPNVPPYIPSWMLYLPAYIALPLLAQMGIRLPPPPNPNMPLGAYLRTLRFPALGRQREVFVLI